MKQSVSDTDAFREYEWIKVNDNAAFAPRDGAGALTFKDRMWLIGGWNPKDKTYFPGICNNEAWSSVEGVDWRLEKPGTFGTESFDPEHDWEGRHTAGYAVFRDCMWIVGGDANQGHYQFDVWNSLNGRDWTQVNRNRPVPWGPRVLHHTVVFEDRMWIMGGQTLPDFAPAELNYYNDVWCTENGIDWDRVTEHAPWSERGMIGGFAVFKNRMWLLGGGTYSTPDFPERKYFNEVWSSPDGIEWECVQPKAPWLPRQYHEVAVFDNRLWVLEGSIGPGGNRNDVWYSSDGRDWVELPDTPWKPRHAASVFVHRDALWMVTGNNMESDVWKLVRKT